MARTADPDFAERVATGVSLEERQKLERLARLKRVKLAAVVRWAVEEYLANHDEPERDDVRAVAAS